jgi:hypothetical protein
MAIDKDRHTRPKKPKPIKGSEGRVSSNSIGLASSQAATEPQSNGRPIRIRSVYQMSSGPQSMGGKGDDDNATEES